MQCGRGAGALYNVLEDKSTGLVRTVRVSPSAEAGALQSAGKDERLRVEQVAQALLARAHKTNRTGTPKVDRFSARSPACEKANRIAEGG